MDVIGKLIILEGLPGVGKTSLGRSYASTHPDVIFLEEKVDEQLLAEYIADMPNKATKFQFGIQEETVEKIKRAIDLVKAGKIVVLDRGLDGNRCFAEVQHRSGLISTADMNAYNARFQYKSIPFFSSIQTHVVYMKAGVQFIQERIHSRARDGEDAYTFEYLSQLEEMHNRFLSDARILDAEVNFTLDAHGMLPRIALHPIMAF